MIGTHTSSVTPGYTVDSKTTTVPLFMFCPISFEAPSTGPRSGVLSSFTGVGTATIIKRAFASSAGSLVKWIVVFLMLSEPTSFVGSIPFLYKSILAAFVSKPITLMCFANSYAIGIPTYPSPTTARVSFLLSRLS